MPVQVCLCYEDLTEFKCLTDHTSVHREHIQIFRSSLSINQKLNYKCIKLQIVFPETLLPISA